MYLCASIIRKMRLRNSNYLLKIAVIFVVFVFLVYLWTFTSDTRKTYLDAIRFKVNISDFKEKMHARKLRIRQHGEYWILENYVIGKKEFGYLDSITYTTHGEYSFLDNLNELVRRWKGPISIALYAPGLDFHRSIRSIDYLRQCAPDKELIAELVTFHIYFPSTAMPSFIPKTKPEFQIYSANCSESPPFVSESANSYRHNQSLTYPINVSRNIARRMATTHFIFPCDIEMYPNLNFIDDFLHMIQRNPHFLFSERQVYPLAVFEVQRDQEIPNTKTDLQEMLLDQRAIPFHMKVCMYCHAIPELDRWIQQKESEPLGIFEVVKHHSNWEPFYVTTNEEPFFDERYTWEGKYDKQIQADLLGLMDYDFLILDNAFLVHRPGIKMHTTSTSPEITRMRHRTAFEVVPQHKILFGSNPPITKLNPSPKSSES